MKDMTALSSLSSVSSVSTQDCASSFEPFKVLEGQQELGLIILADHASARLPESYGTLGLEEHEFSRHIAYDIGIEDVATGLNKALNVPVVMSQFSRLLIDPNRGEDDPTLVMCISDGALIEGNARIASSEVDHRIATYYRPYHQAISDQIDNFLETGIHPIILSLHSFTDNWRGTPRPWHGGILWDRDHRFVHPLLKALQSESHLHIGDNEPYTGQLKGDCMYRHGTSRGLAHALLEIRQDLITSKSGQDEWVDRLASHLTTLLSNEELIEPCREPMYFGSYSDK